MLWSEKHAPQTTAAFAGNKEAAARAKQWALQFSLGKPSKPLLLWGPPGCGKSALARALAQEMGWNLSLIEPPLPGQSERWERQVAAALSGSSLFGAASLVLIEDIDDWSSQARGSVGAITALIKEAAVPVILTARDFYDRPLSGMRTHVEGVALKAVNSADMMHALDRIAAAERSPLSPDELGRIVQAAQGDLRAAVNDLHALNLAASREHEPQLMQQVRQAFRSPTYAAAHRLQVDLSERDTFKLYLSENLPTELPDANDRARGFARISRADMFDGRIRRTQYWGYLRYSSGLLSWGVSSERRHPGPAFVSYAFPSYIMRMGSTRSKRALHKGLAAKISPRTHTTTRTARVFIPLLQAQISSLRAIEGGVDKMAQFYALDEEETAALLDVAPASVSKPAASKAKAAPAAKAASGKSPPASAASGAAPAPSSPPSPSASGLLSASSDGAPAKRPRGRPKKAA